MSSTTLVREKSHYIKNIEKRQSEISETVKKHSIRGFGHPNATLKEIRIEAIRKNLESCYDQN